MNDIKRLGEMERNLTQLTSTEENIMYADICVDTISREMCWLVNFGKEQIERVRELELEVERAGNKANHFKKEHSELVGIGGMWINVSNKLKKVEQQNKCYREVLEFYADGDNYEINIDYDSFGDADDTTFQIFPVLDGEIIDDSGEKARKVLELESNE